MRVVTWLGCTSGRSDYHLNSFGSGMAAISDADGQAVGECDETRLPSERFGRKPVVQEQPSAPLLYTKRKRLTVGASV